MTGIVFILTACLVAAVMSFMGIISIIIQGVRERDIIYMMEKPTLVLGRREARLLVLFASMATLALTVILGVCCGYLGLS